MIEKLNIDPIQSVATNHCIINKINEIVDAVNHNNHEYESIDDVVDDFVKVNESAHKFRSINELLRKELDRTRKALDVAVDALKRANNTYCAEEEDITIDLTESAAHKWQRTAYQMEMPISIALEQITALEQKDVK